MTSSMSRMFLITLFGMIVVAAFVIIATLGDGAQASTPTGPTGADILAAMTAPMTAPTAR